MLWAAGRCPGETPALPAQVGGMVGGWPCMCLMMCMWPHMCMIPAHRHMLLKLPKLAFLCIECLHWNTNISAPVHAPL